MNSGNGKTMPQPKLSFDHVQNIISKVTFPTRKLVVLNREDLKGYLLLVEYYEEDLDKPGSTEKILQKGRKWYISPFSTETEIVETAFKAVKTSILHQTAEHFKYHGERVYSPHFTIGARLAMCTSGCFDRRQD